MVFSYNRSDNRRAHQILFLSAIPKYNISLAAFLVRHQHPGDGSTCPERKQLHDSDRNDKVS
jgi:hypothetical protein